MPPLIDPTKRRFLRHHFDDYLAAGSTHTAAEFFNHLTTKYIKHFGFSVLRADWEGPGTGVHSDDELDPDPVAVQTRHEIIRVVRRQISMWYQTQDPTGLY
ncbi:hypothetical protein B0H13DRAFT_2359929 [Mycena leptocephala]|nr:hypothetical protein B0H13DRAFT_2359929 [Mycena leptocephala]